MKSGEITASCILEVGKLELWFPLDVRDDEAYFNLYADAETMAFLNIPSESDFKYRRKMNRDKFVDGSAWPVDVIHQDSGKLIGVSGFRTIENGEAEFGIIIAKSYQRRGFLKQIWAACLNYAATRLDIHTILVRTTPDNVPMKSFLDSQFHSFVETYISRITSYQTYFEYKATLSSLLNKHRSLDHTL